MSNIREYLKEYKIVADGAFGTYCFHRGLDEKAVPEELNISGKDMVVDIHKAYIAAGARLIRTNTFAANTVSLNRDLTTVKSILRAAYNNAEVASKDSTEKVYVAANIGPIPQNAFENAEVAEDEYKEIIDTFFECGADVFCFETFGETKTVFTLAEYIKNRNPEAFIISQYSLNKYGYTRFGIGAERILKEADSNDNIDAIGFNCGIGSAHLYEILKKMDLTCSKYITAMPNSGYPELIRDRTVYSGNSDYFAENMKLISELGVNILGGCCGTTPTYMEKVTGKIIFENNRELVMLNEKDKKAKTSQVHNSFYQLMESGQKVITVELDPPYDANAEKIMDCAHLLKASGVDMITFADSPMGKPRVDSIMMGIKVLHEVGIPVMPHIACRDKNTIAMRAGIMGAYLNGIRNFLLVTGDPVPMENRGNISGVFDFNSIKLMEYVDEMNREHFKDAPICFGGALNYDRGNLEMEIKRMEKKIQAGAKYFLTQPIFSDSDIEKIAFVKKKTDTKILCGLMPLVSYRNASFIKNEVSGINVPDDVLERFHPDMTREEGEAVGVEIVREIITKLDSIADGYYFMLPFNRVHLVEKILK